MKRGWERRRADTVARKAKGKGKNDADTGVPMKPSAGHAHDLAGGGGGLRLWLFPHPLAEPVPFESAEIASGVAVAQLGGGLKASYAFLDVHGPRAHRRTVPQGRCRRCPQARQGTCLFLRHRAFPCRMPRQSGPTGQRLPQRPAGHRGRAGSSALIRRRQEAFRRQRPDAANRRLGRGPAARPARKRS